MAALAKRCRGRRAGEQQALSSSQQQQIAGLIVGSCPDQLQIPGLVWMRSAVRALIERETGRVLEITTVGRYLKALGVHAPAPPQRGGAGPRRRGRRSIPLS